MRYDAEALRAAFVDCSPWREVAERFPGVKISTLRKRAAKVGIRPGFKGGRPRGNIERLGRAAAAHDAGISWKDIARQFGWSTADVARVIVKRHLNQLAVGARQGGGQSLPAASVPASLVGVSSQTRAVLG